MFEQVLYYIANILAITLQLSAGALLVGNLDNSRKGIIREYCAKHTAIAFDENNNLVDSSDLRATAESTWKNCWAFRYLFAGYLIGIFGEPLPNKLLSFLIVAFLVVIVVAVTCKIATTKSKQFEPIHKDDLPLEGGVAFCIVDSDSEVSE